MSILDQLLVGIRAIESGGQKDPYRVVNSIGAVGAYQVMKDNIPSWTREALGRSLTWQQFRDSREAQDAVARYKLGQYLKKYGTWQAAASTWFSGQPDWNSTKSDGGNTVRQYVEKVGKAMKGGGSTGGTAPVSTMPTLGRSVFTAQQAGYAAETRTGPYGAPTNPFKLPGWIASQSSGTAPGGTAGDVAQIVDGQAAGLFDGDGISVPWDGVSTVVLSSLFVLGGLALVVVGLVSAVSPAATKAAALHPAGKLATAAKAAS